MDGENNDSKPYEQMDDLGGGVTTSRWLHRRASKPQVCASSTV